MLVILIGAVSEGARLSFDLGPLKVQPAEFAKVTTLLALAAYLSDEDRTDDGCPTPGSSRACCTSASRPR